MTYRHNRHESGFSRKVLHINKVVGGHILFKYPHSLQSSSTDGRGRWRDWITGKSQVNSELGNMFENSRYLFVINTEKDYEILSGIVLRFASGWPSTGNGGNAWQCYDFMNKRYNSDEYYLFKFG